jgi:diguanylate cyclase (GGDEF)-like protein
VDTRAWNSTHGGVWVIKGPGVASNPDLVRLGVSPDATATDGRVFTLRNPALMTREISEIMNKRQGVTFRLTSLKPVNPLNAPDAWEREALLSFERGVTEAYRRSDASGTPVLRYMRPLTTDHTCLRCHAVQGYRVGDIRGAVSVSVPVAEQGRILTLNALGLTGLYTAVTAVLLGLTWLMVKNMRVQITAAEEALVKAATVDALTGAWTRRHTIERLTEEAERAHRDSSHLALAMVDVDNFKHVNDRLGHAVGDAVLTEVTHRMDETLRPYDGIGRMGGEEFLIIAPSTDTTGGAALGKRIRDSVAAEPVRAGDVDVPVTISVGVADLGPAGPGHIDRALAQADSALYASKKAGRDRVTVFAEGMDVEDQDS